MNKQQFKLWSVKAVIAIFALIAVRGEAQVLTLIPTEVKPKANITISADQDDKPTGLAALSFKSDAMPAGVTIAKVALVMNIQDAGTGAGQTIYVYVKKSGSASVDEIFRGLQSSAWRNDDVVTGKIDEKTYTLKRLQAAFDRKARWQVEPNDWPDLGVSLKEGFTLILGGTGGGKRGRQFYGLAGSPTKLRPRLIVEYTSSGQPTVAQPADVQSGKGFLPSAQPQILPSSFKYKTVPLNVPSSGIWSYAPAFYNNFVYFMTIDGGKYYLSWRRPLWAIAGRIEISGSAPGKHLLVSKSGHLYIVGDKKILPYKIRSDGASEPRTVSPEGTPTQTGTETDLDPDAQHAPTLGADGSMFYVSGSVNSYRVAGRNPDMQELWSVPVVGPTSRVTLGPSGRYVYLTTEGEGLVIIDARTGEDFKKNPLPNVTHLKTDVVPYLTTPVVFKESDGTEKVYVAKDFVNHGVLALFNNEKTKDGDDGRITTGWKHGEALFGQPLITKDKVYVVRVDGSKASVEYLDRSTGVETKATPPLDVPLDGFYLQKGGNLAADADGDVFAWDGFASNGQTASGYFKGFNASDALLKSLFNQEMKGELERKSNLFFGADGTLYAGAQQSTLYAIVPYSSLAGMTLPVAITSPTNLWVGGEVAAPAVLTGKGNSLTAGSVMLGPNFTVAKEATLTVTIK